VISLIEKAKLLNLHCAKLIAITLKHNLVLIAFWRQFFGFLHLRNLFANLALGFFDVNLPT
jgi:hypothetical protein